MKKPRPPACWARTSSVRGFDFELFVHTGAGRYICGEETALINSLEGRRANPRSKPPFPAAVGVWGKPTCVNNVETLCNVPAIIADGVDWYKSLAREGSEDMGTKLMGFSGKVKNPGLWELPFGVTARELFEDYAGGMRDGYKLKAWQPGGAGTGFLLPEHLDAQMYAGGIAKVGTRMGTGLAMAVDDSVNMVSLLRNMEQFFARESCGFCTPCRDGLPWSVKLLMAIENGEGQPGRYRDPAGSGRFPRPRQDLLCSRTGRRGAIGQRNQILPSRVRSRYRAYQRRRPASGKADRSRRVNA